MVEQVPKSLGFWIVCNSEAVSFSYLFLGAEGRQWFRSQESNYEIDKITTRSLWVL